MIRVLQSFPRDGPQTNPYLTQLVANMPPEVTTIPWSWSGALFGRYDVLHLHWPEALFRRSDRMRTAAHQVLFTALMLRIAVTRRIAVVRTMHNPKPHEPGGWPEAGLLRWCDQLTTLRIALNESIDPSTGPPYEVIAHGHYRDAYDAGSQPQKVRGRLLYFGLVRQYKGVLDLIAAFHAVHDADLSLRILGSPNSAQLQEAILAAGRTDARIGAVLSYVEDEALVRAVGAAELVVLPYTELHNSGAVLMALSLDRPVLVPQTPATIALAEEVGPGWVLTYRGRLDAQILLDGLARSRTTPRSLRPDLSARDWPELGRRHLVAYLRALNSRRS